MVSWSKIAIGQSVNRSMFDVNLSPCSQLIILHVGEVRRSLSPYKLSFSVGGKGKKISRKAVCADINNAARLCDNLISRKDGCKTGKSFQRYSI